MSCPCGKGPSLEECCGPIIEGTSPAPTAEALMRSRYSAYTSGAVDYVIASHDPETRDSVDREGAESWSSEAEWEGLQILDVVDGAEGDDEGIVEFVATYRAQGQRVSHRERSTFRRIEGAWHYIDGDIVKATPTVRDQPKVGRNEPCPCGSGKKYKKCCA